jgi:hypothetical protein
MFRIAFTSYAVFKLICQNVEHLIVQFQWKKYIRYFVLVNEHSGKLSNHWNLNEFIYIYIMIPAILLFSTCTLPYVISELVKLVRPYIHISTERCLVKFSGRPTVPEGTDNTKFTHCSGCLHDFLKFECCALLLRGSTYVLLIPPQLSWQPNPIGMCALFCPQRVVFVASRPRALLWENIPISKAISSNFSHVRQLMTSVWMGSVGNE